MKKDFKDWFIGFFDGEGYFNTFSTNQYKGFEIAIAIAERDRSVLYDIQDYFKVGNVVRKFCRVEMYAWRVRDQKGIKKILSFFNKNKLRTNHKRKCLEIFKKEFESYDKSRFSRKAK